MADRDTGVRIEEDNSNKVLSELEKAKLRAMEIIGQHAEKYAKAVCPVGTSESTGKKGYRGGTLRNSITHVSTSEGMTVGSNVEYAPFVELGTGPFFNAPPAWEEFAPYEKKGDGAVHYVRPRPFLRPAIEEQLSEFQAIVEQELSK